MQAPSRCHRRQVFVFSCIMQRRNKPSASNGRGKSEEGEGGGGINLCRVVSSGRIGIADKPLKSPGLRACFLPVVFPPRLHPFWPPPPPTPCLPRGLAAIARRGSRDQIKTLPWMGSLTTSRRAASRRDSLNSCRGESFIRKRRIASSAQRRLALVV